MDKKLRMRELPRGPWVSEDEMRAIMNTDADAEFEAIMAEKEQRRKVVAFWRWVAAACAAVIVGISGWWIMSGPATESQGTKDVFVKMEREGKDNMESYAQAHDSSHTVVNPHTHMWGYRKNRGAATTISVTPHRAERSVGTEPTTEGTSVRPGVRLNQTEPHALAFTDIPVLAETQADIFQTDELDEQGTPPPMTVDEIIYNMEAEERAERFRQRMAYPTPELITELIYLAITNE